ncbi:MAG: hypothetical protein ACOC0Z_01640, partial [Halohasta sp.]
MTPAAGRAPVLFAEAIDSLDAIVSAAVETLPIQRLVLLAALLLAIGTLVVLRRPAPGFRSLLRERFVGGLPWGTLVVSGLLLVVYFGVQSGYADPNDPVVLPFRAWSYLDPLGMLLAGFSHASQSHLTSNLLGTLVFGTLAEWWWGHYPPGRSGRSTDGRRNGGLGGRREPRWQRLWTDPVARAVVIFPASAICVGLVGTAVALGPVIGFSVVTFAFAGFTLVRFPMVTIVASVGQGVISTLYAAARAPQEVASAGAEYSTPWFASIAVQGHAIGLLLGILVGIALLWHREESPPTATDIWVGITLLAVSKSLWAVYWFRGNDTYVLYRAVGLALVFVLVAIVASAVAARHEPLFPERAVVEPEAIVDSLASITGREVGLLVLVATAALVASPAIPVNLTTADDGPLAGEPIEVEGYEVTYAEDTPDGQLSAIPLEGFGESTQLNTSGVIVRNTDRHIWSTDVPAGELATEGEATVRLGGVGWDETVTANRTGWQAVGGASAYQVDLAHDDRRRTVFASGEARVEPVVAGYRLSINATQEDFFVDAEPLEPTTETDATNETNGSTANGSDTGNASDDGNTSNATDEDAIVLTDVPNASSSVDPVRVPAEGESAELGPIRVETRADRVFAVYNGTAVRIAQ